LSNYNTISFSRGQSVWLHKWYTDIIF